jgi:hypothetical protein
MKRKCSRRREHIGTHENARENTHENENTYENDTKTRTKNRAATGRKRYQERRTSAIRESLPSSRASVTIADVVLLTWCY